MPVPTRNVVLTDHQDQFIDLLLESGRYQNASEILREGLRLVERREASDAVKLAGLQAAARLGIAALDCGDFREYLDANQLMKHIDTLAAAHSAADEGK